MKAHAFFVVVALSSCSQIEVSERLENCHLLDCKPAEPNEENSAQTSEAQSIIFYLYLILTYPFIGDA